MEYETDDNTRPTKAEVQFLNLAYNEFYNIFDEIFIGDIFYSQSSYYRFSRIREAFCIYGEVQSYEPIQWALKDIEEHRPFMESVIAKDLFKAIRNIFSHFPYFSAWDDVWLSEELVNWYKPNQSIDKFIKKYADKDTVKYRFWDDLSKTMTYISIRFPTLSEYKTRIYLKDMLTEKDGVKFSMILMKKVMDTCVEK
ncbi:hypothetical protein [Anaerosporobacter faecicola]|uniref:hypothetical protein n=1 Tax=Anaerosporobacter faecicola TaxID=2718714 RepID=UPI00143AF591|nr:hypothetical protein [Anaerosporobacter faecicola]